MLRHKGSSAGVQIFTVAELLKGGKPYPRMMKEGRAVWGNARPSHNLAKVGVEGSNPFARSSFPNRMNDLKAALGRP